MLLVLRLELFKKGCRTSSPTMNKFNRLELTSENGREQEIYKYSFFNPQVNVENKPRINYELFSYEEGGEIPSWF